MTAESPQVDASVLDLESYDLPGLRADIQQILDLPTAIEAVFKKSAVAIFLGAALVWIVFRPRMPLWALVPYVALATVALVLAAGAISAFLVLKSRIEATDRAADRTLFTVAAMHGDLLHVQGGGGELPLRAVATFLAQTVVFPILIGSAGSMLEAAATTATPLGWFSRTLLNRAFGEVEKRLLVALEAVNEEQIESGLPEPQDGVAVDSWAELPVQDLPNQIRGWYEAIHRHLSRVVDGLEVLTVGGAGATTALAVFPFALLVGLGFLLT